MPRLRDDFLECACYFYRSEHEASEGVNIGGSGFLISMPADVPGGGKFCYAVTNRHVIAQANVIRLNTRDGRTVIASLPKNTWTPSETDDLATRLISLPNWLAHKSIHIGLILTEDMARNINLGIGDNVFLVGRFINHEGKQRNAPLVRFGAIAQMPADPVEYQLDGKTHFQRSIIADVRSIGGFSGSPVFLNEQNFIGRPDATQRVESHWLIGIDWGHIPMWAPVCGLGCEPVGHGQVNINSGMAGIVPSWALLELLMGDKLTSERKVKEELFAKAIAGRGAVPDVVIGTDPPASDENPTHREDFNSLVSVAARKREQED